MTIEDIKILIEKTSDNSKEDLRKIALGLPIFDSCNFILWMKKLRGIEISI